MGDQRVADLHDACRNGADDLVRYLLESNVRCNTHDPRTGKTAVCLAAQAGHAQIVETLLTRGKNVKVDQPMAGTEATALDVVLALCIAIPSSRCIASLTSSIFLATLNCACSSATCFFRASTSAACGTTTSGVALRASTMAA